jgi:uncharacterized protein (TIGR02996 family)
MTDHEHFLQAILADPDSDTPRLIYADWLEEQGDPRGEFIRTQCEAAALPLDSERRLMLLRRGEKMQKQAQWLADLRRICVSLECRRGVVEQVSLTAEDFLAHAQVLHKAETLIGLHLAKLRPQQIPRLAPMPELSRFTRLDLSGNRLEAADVLRLLASPHLVHVNTLVLNGCHLNDDDVAELAASELLVRLISLHLGFNNIGDHGALRLANSLHFQRLQWLDLFGNTELFVNEYERTLATSILKGRFRDRVRL